MIATRRQNPEALRSLENQSADPSEGVRTYRSKRFAAFERAFLVGASDQHAIGKAFAEGLRS